jgi:hypothetical protein
MNLTQNFELGSLIQMQHDQIVEFKLKAKEFESNSVWKLNLI